MTSLRLREVGVKEGILANLSVNVQPPRRMTMMSCLVAASSGSFRAHASPAKKMRVQVKVSALGPWNGSGASETSRMGAAPIPVGAMAVTAVA